MAKKFKGIFSKLSNVTKGTPKLPLPSGTEKFATRVVDKVNKFAPNGIKIGNKRYQPGVYGKKDKKTQKIKKSVEIDSYPS